MTGQHINNNEISYDKEMCRKISLAIKKSKVFDHIKPLNLLKKKLGIEEDNVFDNHVIPQKISRSTKNPRQLGSPIKSGNANSLLPTPNQATAVNRKVTLSAPVTKETALEAAKSSSIEKLTPEIQNKPIENVNKAVKSGIIEKSKSPLNLSSGLLLPSPDSLFDEINKDSDKSSIKSEIIEEEGSEFSICNQSDINPFQEEYLKEKSNIMEKLSNTIKEKSLKNDKIREKKQNLNLFSLATSLLPIPSLLNDKQSIIMALENGNLTSFIELFKEGIQNENQISVDDLREIIDAIIKSKKLSVVCEFVDCLEYTPLYATSLSESFVKYHLELKDYKENFLNCLLTMIESGVNSTYIAFIEACSCVNDWNRMWSAVLTKDPTYKFDEKYFNSCMAIFQNLNNNSIIINHDTMLIIISYIMRNYYDNYEVYMADIWLYCVLTTDINSDTDLKVPQQILDKVIEKLIIMKNPSFLFIMKLLSKNWTLICNNTFCVWLSRMISEKSDVKQCLCTVKDSMESVKDIVNDVDLSNSFFLLTLNVMSILNKKSLFASSKNIYDTFLQMKSESLKTLLLKRVDRFTYKWIIVECLISSTEYEKALRILKEFDVLKDLESNFLEYNKVKEMLPNLVWHLLNSQDLLSIIDLFEQVVSIFIFNEKTDNSYRKNCNEIFDLIVIKAFDSNNKDVVKKMILFLDQIVSADIEFNISKESLRYLLVAGVRTNVPFNELLDFIELCFKFGTFEAIKLAEDGFGSIVDVYSNLTVEEMWVLTTWCCRQVKIKLVELAQSEVASMRENLMKVCSLKFVLRPFRASIDCNLPKLGPILSISEFLAKFTETLATPKYLSHPIKFAANTEVHNEVKIVCDNRVVYNAIYYSDI